MDNNICGIINVYKEKGFTSHDVVAKLRGILKIKKIGHTGTLDPDAVGVLPVCIGQATKVCDLLTDESKEYVALMKLGITTDTQDSSGKILADNSDKLNCITEEMIMSMVNSFIGEIEQIPPMYSAIKVDGKKLYELARAGIEIERKPRKISIHSIDVISIDMTDYTVKMKVCCSKGTYIRTLCHDIGNKLGCGAVMEHLERTRVGIFTSEEAYTLSEIEKLRDDDGLHNVIATVDSLFSDYEALHVMENGMKALNNGNQLQENTIKEYEVNEGFKRKQVYRIYSYDNRFYGLFEYHSAWKVFKPVKMFLPVNE